MDIQVRYAETESEREAVYRLRYEIYNREMNLESPAVDHDRRVLTDANDDTARILYATVDGELAGTLRIHWGGDAPFPDEFEETYQFDHFRPVVADEEMVVFSRLMVRKEHRGSMVPVEFFAHIARFSIAQGARLTFCDCQPHLLNLYTMIGYRTYATTYNDIMMGLLVPLVVVVEDLAHFRAIGSPLLQFSGEDFRPDPPTDILALLPAAPTVQPVPGDAAADWARTFGLLAESHEETTPIFEGLSDDAVNQIMQRSFVITCEKDDLVIQKRAVDRTMFIVLAGLLEVREGDRVVAVASRGDVLGELAFLLHGERLSDVYAASDDAKVLSLNEKAVMSLMEEQPAIAARLFLNLSRVVAAKVTSLYHQATSSA